MAEGSLQQVPAAPATITPYCETTWDANPNFILTDVQRIASSNWITGYDKSNSYHSPLILYRQNNCGITQYDLGLTFHSPIYLLPKPGAAKEFVLFSNFETTATVGDGPVGTLQIKFNDMFWPIKVKRGDAGGVWMLTDGFIAKAALAPNHFLLVGDSDMDEGNQVGWLSIINPDLTLHMRVYTPLNGMTVDGQHFDGFAFYDACHAGNGVVVLARTFHSPEEEHYNAVGYAILKYGYDGTLLWSKIPHIGQSAIRPLALLMNDINGYVLLSRIQDGSNRLLLQGFNGRDAMLWRRYYEGIGSGVWDIRPDLNDNTQVGYLIYGHQSLRGWLMRLDMEGNLLCADCVEQASADKFLALVTTKPGEYMAIGENGGLSWHGQFTLDCHSSLAADFSANVCAGPAPFRVTFSDHSSGSIQSWLWDFGDGESSTEPEPTHIYRDPGKYTVTLKISDGSASAEKQKSDFILVYEATQHIYTLLQKNITVDGILTDWNGVPALRSTDNPDNSFPNYDFNAQYRMAWDGLDRWYIAFSISDEFIGHTTALSSFASDPNGSYGVTRYYLNDCIEAVFARDTGSAKFESFKLVFAPDEPARSLYQAEDIRLHPWLDWGTTNPVLAPWGDRSAKTPPQCRTVVVAQSGGWHGEAEILLKSPPDPSNPYRFIFSGNDIDDQSDAASRHHINTTGGNLDVWAALDQLFGAMPVMLFDQSAGVEASASAVPAFFTLQCAPNPFNAATRLTVSLPAAEQAEVVVYDIRGARMATVAAGRFDSGVHELLWQGEREDGTHAPSGLYLIRWQGERHQSVVKVTLVR